MPKPRSPPTITDVADGPVVDVADAEELELDAAPGVEDAMAAAPGVEDAVALTKAPGATNVCVTVDGIPLTESAATLRPTGGDTGSGPMGRGAGIEIACAIAAAEATTPMPAKRSSLDTDVLLSSVR